MEEPDPAPWFCSDVRAQKLQVPVLFSVLEWGGGVGGERGRKTWHLILFEPSLHPECCNSYCVDHKLHADVMFFFGAAGNSLTLIPPTWIVNIYSEINPL